MPHIPLVNLHPAHDEIADDIAVGFKRVFANTAFVGGAEVAAFEAEYAEFNGGGHCVGVANGTDAIELALLAVGVGRGDDVVLPANTFVATAEAVVRAGANPVLVDCDPATYLVDVPAALAAVTDATRAVIPVHLYGQHAPVEQLRDGLAGRDVAVVEDAAQSQGARRHGAGAGAGGIAATSFYPGKNLGAYGDAGAVVTTDEALATAVRRIANHGGLTKYAHDVVGVNSRLDALQAVVLRAKLARLARWNAARQRAAGSYDELLADVDVTRPVTLDGNTHVWHLYVVRVPGDGGSRRRDAVLRRLNEDGVGAGIHYPTPVHLTPAFTHLGYAAGAFPHAERAANEILSLPLHPHLTTDEQEQVVRSLRNALRVI